jgi:hypothetical protein
MLDATSAVFGFEIGVICGAAVSAAGWVGGKSAIRNSNFEFVVFS